MRFFFKSRKFKIIAAVLAGVLLLSIISFAVGGIISPQSDLVGALLSPFNKIATSVSNHFEDEKAKKANNEKLILENAELQKQINELREKTADYEAFKSQNDFYKDYLEIKTANPDFRFADAVIITRDASDEFAGFTIDKGSMNGIEKYDPVITDAGLVGYVSAVGLITSKVTTILSPDIAVGALCSRTRDAGIVAGTLGSAAAGNTRMANVQRTSSVAVGDYIATSGSGVFPAGILIGKIKSISQEQYGTSLYAEIETFADIKNIRQVMVITDFEGKNHINISGDEE